MTPKEKAIDLVERFNKAIKAKVVCDNNPKYGVKECALIAVNEIEKAIDFDWMEVQNLDREHSYWQEVKEEIHKI